MLLGASRSITEQETRKKARLISAITLANALLLTQAAIATHQQARLPLILTAGALLMVVAYALSRTAAVNAAALLTVAVELAIPPVVAIALRDQPNFHIFNIVVWILPGLLLASVLGSARTTIVAALGAIAALLLLAALGPAAWASEILDGFVFLSTGAVLIIVFGVFRDGLERDRRTELDARNHELETLQRSLEARVDERTHELLAVNVEMDTAYQQLKHNQQILLAAETMASLGRVTAGIAHEMNSPLAAATMSLSSASELIGEYQASIGDPSIGNDDHRDLARELGETVTLAGEATQRLCAFVRTIRAQTRGASERVRVRFDAVAAVRDALQLLQHAAMATRSRLIFEPTHERAPMDGDPGRLAQIVTNLVGNAIYANGELGGGDVTIVVADVPDGLDLSVRDVGPGIPDDIRDRIFEPLFTTKPVGHGTGLGLAIVQDIVVGDFGGRIDVTSQRGAGATFTVHLPACVVN